MPFVPTTVSSRIAATCCGALDHQHVARRCASARSHSSACVVAWNAERYGYGPQNLTDARHAGFAVPAPRVAGERDRAGGGAVVAAVGRQHLVPPGVQAGHADRVLGGLGAAVGEEHHVRSPGASSAISRAASLRMSLAMAGATVHSRSACSLMAATSSRVLVADVDVDQLAGEVEVAVALVVPEPGALGAGDRRRGSSAPCADHEWNTWARSFSYAVARYGAVDVSGGTVVSG